MHNPFLILNTKAKNKNFNILAGIIAEIIAIFVSLILVSFFETDHIAIALLLVICAISIILQWALYGDTRFLYLMTLPFAGNRKKEDISEDITSGKMQEQYEADVGIRYFIEKEKKKKEYHIDFLP